MIYRELLAHTSSHNHSLVCMGADPVIERIPTRKSSLEDSIFCFYEDIINALFAENEMVSAVKPNYAFYAQYGFEGLRALKRLINFSKANNLPVILDAKRGDIGRTNIAYTNEIFDFFKADATTISPFMGSDSVEPFLARCRKEGKGIYILARTSNIGAKDFQNLVTKEGKPLFLEVVEKIILWAESGNGNVGAVVGATSMNELSEIAGSFANCRQVIPLLIPGVGTQGGSASDVISSLVKASKEAGLDDNMIKTNLLSVRISSSSGINYAYEKKRMSDYAKAAAEAVGALNDEIEETLRKEGIKLY